MVAIDWKLLAALDRLTAPLRKAGLAPTQRPKLRRAFDERLARKRRRDADGRP